MTTTSLLTLFMPPDGFTGDFGMVCGFTATRQILERMKNSFSADKSRPALAAFIHPTANAISDVPGLAWIWMPSSGYKLLHAKVALLGFHNAVDGRYVIRLAVTTGNWTEAPLTSSIDLFWSIDLPTDAAGKDLQAVADIRAAWALFAWLRQRGDASLLVQTYDGHRPDARLSKAIDALPASTRQPRFIDSRSQPLFDQIVERLARGQKRNRLILGSGYFEDGGEPRDSVPTDSVPERFRQALIKRGKLDSSAPSDLFLNPESCQGIVERRHHLQEQNWRLRPPRPVHDSGEPQKLHAKFALLALNSDADGFQGRLYLGSGNFSRAGMETAASAGGNLEAGVVFALPDKLQWRANGRLGIHRFLPIAFDDEVDPQALSSGAPFELPDAPEGSPPTTFLLWQQDQLVAPGNAAIEVIGPNGSPSRTPCPWPTPAPSFVTVLPGRWRIPVISDGALVVPQPQNLTVDDLLAGLARFPDGIDEDPDTTLDDIDGAATTSTCAPDVDNAEQRYPIRRMMTLLVRLSQAQAKVDARDWRRWCRELRQGLMAIQSQETGMIEFFRRANANPLPVLLQRGFLPKGVGRRLLKDSLDDVAQEWDVFACPSLWEDEP